MAKPPWTSEMMRDVLSRAEGYARRAGYVLAAGGSVPRTGTGRDLDLFAIRLSGGVEHGAFLDGLCQSLNTYACEGTVSADGANVAWGDRHWIDLVFVDAPNFYDCGRQGVEAIAEAGGSK